MQASTAAEVAARVKKIMTLKKNIKTQATLDKVMASLPEKVRAKVLKALDLKF